MIECCLTFKTLKDSFIRNVWMKECRFLFGQIMIIEKIKQTLFVTWLFFHRVGCDFISFWSLSAYFPCLMIFFYSNESVCVATGDEAGHVHGGGYEEHAACIYCTFVIWVCFSCFPVFSLHRESPGKLWTLFSDTVLSTRVVNISPAQKKKNDDMFCSFTTN